MCGWHFGGKGEERERDGRGAGGQFFSRVVAQCKLSSKARMNFLAY